MSNPHIGQDLKEVLGSSARVIGMSGLEGHLGQQGIEVEPEAAFDTGYDPKAQVALNIQAGGIGSLIKVAEAFAGAASGINAAVQPQAPKPMLAAQSPKPTTAPAG